jgi:NAD(P)H-dependent flavin oxidoreductase YrpB (nitropropane dioxygenase family)
MPVAHPFFPHLYTMRTRLTDMLHLEHPLIMAPMFLVSNVAMTKEGMRCGRGGLHTGAELPDDSRNCGRPSAR